MSRPLRILLLEDSPDDAQLILHELRRAGFEPSGDRVETEADFVSHLDPELDLILADYLQIEFDAFRALQLVQERGLEVPVIVVTGALGDEAAVECLRRGAVDYLLKDRLARLGSAVENALEQKQAHDDRRRAEAALRESEARKTAILEAAVDGIFMIDHQGCIIEFNPAAEQVLGFTKDEVIGRPMTELIKPPPWSERQRRSLEHYAATGEVQPLGPTNEMTALHADGTEFPVEITFSLVHMDGPPIFNVCIRDITERKAGEEARQRLADIVESSDDAIIGITIEGDITSWNRGAREIFGYIAEEVVGRPIALLDPPGHVNKIRRLLARIRRGERIKHYEAIRRRKDGAEIVVSLTLSPIRDAWGKVIGASQIARDVTAQKLAEREVKRLNHELQERVGELQTLLDVLPIGVWIGDATAEAIFGNRAAYEMLGILAGTNLSLTSPEARMGRSPGFRCLRDGKEIPPDQLEVQVVARTGIGQRNYERDFVFDDGRTLTIQGSAAPLFDDRGKVRGVVSANIDITKLKEAEKQLREADRRKDEFLAILSHELRTPLTPVLMTVSAMLDQPPDIDEMRSAMVMIRDNVEVEARLIDDLLDLTRLVHGKMQLNREVVDIHDVLRRACETCRDVIHAGQFRFAVDFSATKHHAEVDQVRLQQIFWNLIKNAAKFTPPGGEISIRSRYEPKPAHGRGDGCLIVEFSDNGIGIEPEYLPRIFRAFEQADTRPTRRHGGLGLGLAISQRLAEAHGGHLTAASGGKNQGATFTLRLPAASGRVTAPRVAPPIPSEISCFRSLRFLLVEDNKDTLRYLAWVLGQRSHRVRPAADLATARDLAASEPFDLLISDIELPDGSGLELMNEIKSTRGFPGIAMSGFGSEEDVRMSEAAGFVAHLTKPITFQTLEATIRRVVMADDPVLELSQSAG